MLGIATDWASSGSVSYEKAADGERQRRTVCGDRIAVQKRGVGSSVDEELGDSAARCTAGCGVGELPAPGPARSSLDPPTRLNKNTHHEIFSHIT
eukprot:3061773-Prymnesium_polylepis.1